MDQNVLAKLSLSTCSVKDVLAKVFLSSIDQRHSVLIVIPMRGTKFFYLVLTESHNKTHLA